MAESGLALDGIDRRALRVGRRVLRVGGLPTWPLPGGVMGTGSQVRSASCPAKVREEEPGAVGGVIAKDVGVGQKQGWAALSPSLPEGAHPRPAELYRC